MIGRRTPERPRFKAVRSEEGPAAPAERELAVKWGVGCLVGTIALFGVGLLSLAIALFFDVPSWVQVVLGVSLTLGAVVLAWLVAAAVGRSREHQAGRR